MDAFATSEPAVEVRELARRYEVGGVDVHALRGVSLAVQPGEFLGMVGVSGSGKSTLLHLMGGLDTPSSGEVAVALSLSLSLSLSLKWMRGKNFTLVAFSLYIQQ